MIAARITSLMIFFLSFFWVTKEALADYRNYCQWRMGYGLMGGFGFLLVIGFWVLIVVLIILLIRRLITLSPARTASMPQGDSALEILKKRYARGEIDKEEFEAKKKDLS
jgi:putative membrane protein